MPTTILDGETYEQARHRRFTEEAKVIEKMQQDEIIRMAIDAGLGEYLHLDSWRFTPDGDDIKSLERFYELAYATGAAHEREACAKSVYDSTDWAHEERDMVLKEAIAAAIRARGENGS